MDEQRQRMRSLIDRLNAASDAYYNGRGELMTDYEWDALFDELKRLEGLGRYDGRGEGGA